MFAGFVMMARTGVEVAFEVVSEGVLAANFVVAAYAEEVVVIENLRGLALDHEATR